VSRPGVWPAIRRFLRLVQSCTVAGLVVGAGFMLFSPTLPVLGHADPGNLSGLFIIFLFGVCGFVIGGVAAWLMANSQRRFERDTDPGAIYGMALISTVPTFAPPEWGGAALPLLTHPVDEAAEAYRTLATVMRARRGTAKFLVVAVSGAEVGAGATTTVANCGLALAQMGERVLVIDGDPLARGLTQLLVEDTDTSGLGIPPMGLSELLEGRPLNQTIFPAVGDTGLMVVPSGRSTDMAVHRWRSSILRAALVDLSHRFDIILIDTPPMSTSSFSLDLAGVAGHLVVVIPHLDLVEPHQAMARRVPVVGIDLIGYVYNGASSNTRFAPYFPIVRGARHGSDWEPNPSEIPIPSPRHLAPPEEAKRTGWPSN